VDGAHDFPGLKSVSACTSALRIFRLT
jgi:hypothetical protein